MRHSAEARRVSDALTLRKAALTLLGSRPLSDEDCRIVTGASPDAWRILLTCECCALPLAARIRARGLLDTLSADVRDRIAAAELVEMQRVLAARALLDSLDNLGTDLGIAPIVLKGGALAAERDAAPLDLGDVDVLVDESVAGAVWNGFASLGWRLKTGGRMPRAAPRVDPNHFVPIVSPSTDFVLELHTRAEYGSGDERSTGHRSRPLRGRLSLRRLVGAAGFVTVLEHCVIKHPPRRGHLRDLVLLADSLAEANGEHEVIEGALVGQPMAPELRAMYAQVCALARGERVLDDDATTAFVSWKYAMFVHTRGLFGPFVPGWSGLSYLPLERHDIRRSALVWQLAYALGPVPASSPFASLSGKGPGDRVPRLGGVRAVGARAARAVYRLGLLTTLVLTSSYIRRRVRAMRQP